jgi:4-amino-4-deoxy-L-arabinose transferase-like glycosyltransferase
LTYSPVTQTQPPVTRRDVITFTTIALVIGTVMAALVRHPGYTDAYYYYNAAHRLVTGQGFTDAGLWTYIGNPPTLPTPSFLYWMPLTSLVAALGMTMFGPTFDAAQVGFVLLYVGLGLVGFWLGWKLGQTRRTTWISGLFTLFSGYFMIYWTMTSTFATFGFVGSLALVTMGLGRTTGKIRWFVLSGAMSALAHLTRADGVLLLIVLFLVILWPKPSQRWRFQALTLAIAAYLIVMMPFFIRNIGVMGSILPVGGFQTVWMRSYDDIAKYPPDTTLSDFMAWSIGNIAASRWQALTGNTELGIGGTLAQFIGQEGMLIFMPLMLYGFWQRKNNPLLAGFALYALGLHLAMTFVFAFPGQRGGLFHSSAALFPFWSAFAILGLDDAIAWVAKKRRWRVKQAQTVFGVAAVIWTIGFSCFAFLSKLPEVNNSGAFFTTIAAHLPRNAVVVINDPSAMYYYTGISGVVVPNNPPDVMLALSRQYGVNTLILDRNTTAPLQDIYEGKAQSPYFTHIKSLHINGQRVEIYRIRP